MNRVVDTIIKEWTVAGDTYEWLNLSCLRLTAVPLFPEGVQRLTLFGNNLVAIDFLPDTIIELNIACNSSLTRLCKLPPRLRSLSCSFTALTELPELPDTLRTLSCRNSCLTTLPRLPPYLNALYVNDSMLISLPDLPPELATLVCFNNNLTTIPYLPSKMFLLLDYNNPFVLQDMRWNGRDVCDYTIHTYDQIHKWLVHTGDRDVEVRKAMWDEFFREYR